VRRFAIAALAALLAVGSFAQNAGASPVGRWSISSARGDDQSRVQLRIEYSDSSGSGSWNSSWSSPVALSDAGIPADRLRGPVGPVTFRMQREPGTFDCTGSAGEGSGAGQFRYEPSAKFDDALASRGLARPTFQQSLELAIAGATLGFVDQLRASSQHATTADIVRVVQHGVNPKYIAELAALGYRTSSLDELVRLRDHGVTPDFVRAIQAAGYRDLSAGDLVRLVDHGVGERYIAEMRAAGYTKVTADELITLRDHGVTPRYIGDLGAAGYKNLGASDLITLRDHGVSAAFVGRLKSHGYANLSVHDLIRLRDSGI
jgi:hypothetical protein